jgi:hypothetical protein
MQTRLAAPTTTACGKWILTAPSIIRRYGRSKSAWEVVCPLPPTLLLLGQEAILYYESTREGDVRVSVFNTLGLLVREQQASFQKGDNYLAVDLSDLSAGNYILRLEDGTQTPLVQQIIVK